MNSLERKISPVAEPALAPVNGGAQSAGENPSTAKLGRWAWLIVLVLLVLVIVGTVPRWLHRAALKKETLELATPIVQVVHAVPGKASASLLLPAEVRAFIEAPIYARASGFLTNWYQDIGAQVKANQPLAEIDTPELVQQLDGARSELVQAEAAEALANVTATRWAELQKTSSVSEQENEEKQADLKLKIAAVDTAKANVRRLEEVESFTHVVAPFAGTITARDVDVGDLISSGKELFRLSDSTKLRVFVRVPQSATPGIATGVAAEMTLPEMPAKKFPAKVVRTAGAIDASSRTLLTELEVDNSNGEILPGSYAQVGFAAIKQDPQLVLPSNTLLFRGEGPQVGVVEAEGHVQLKNITIGRDFGKTVEVVAGITPEDRVIINPVDSLTSGATVRVAETPTAGTAQ